MGLMDGLKKAVEEALGQVAKPGNSPKIQDTYFTDNFQKKAKEWKLSEKDALDVYYHGEERKPNMRVRTYNGYELGIYYVMAAAKPDRYIFQQSGSDHGDKRPDNVPTTTLHITDVGREK